MSDFIKFKDRTGQNCTFAVKHIICILRPSPLVGGKVMVCTAFAQAEVTQEVGKLVEDALQAEDLTATMTGVIQ